jgi:hypothetical protein
MGNSQVGKLGDEIFVACVNNDISKLLKLCGEIESINSNLEISTKLLDKHCFSLEWKPCLLHLLVELDRLDMMDYLNAAFDFIDMDVRDDTGFTPLILSIKKRDINAVNTLIKQGASVDLSNMYDMRDSPLHYAVNQGDFTIVELLITYRVNVNTANIEGMTPLMYSCQSNNPGIIEYLLENGADPIIRDNYNNSSLHYALKSNVDRSTIELLLRSCDPYTILLDKNASGETLDGLLKSNDLYSSDIFLGKSTNRDNSSILPEISTARDLTLDFRLA